MGPVGTQVVKKNSGPVKCKLANEFLLNWLKQPGNYARYAKANGNRARFAKGSEKVGLESRGVVAEEVYHMYAKAGGKHTMITMKSKLWDWTRRYCRAHAVATKGGSKDMVLKEFGFYYDLVDHIGEDSNILVFDHNKKRPVTELEPPRSYVKKCGEEYEADAIQQLEIKQQQEMIQMMDAIEKQQRYQHEQMNHFLDKRQDFLYQQSHRCRLQQMQIQASLILSLGNRMKDAGFTEDEIASNIRLLYPLEFEIQNENDIEQKSTAS